jgi:hypothetical protein
VSDVDALGQFLAGTCPECGTPGPQRHLSAVNGCGTCVAEDPRPVVVPVRNQHAGVIAYDFAVPPQPGGQPWTPFRDNLPRAVRCYRAGAGFTVHVKPECRCKR